jgi:hypothetical protein
VARVKSFDASNTQFDAGGAALGREKFGKAVSSAVRAL